MKKQMKISFMVLMLVVFSFVTNTKVSHGQAACGSLTNATYTESFDTVGNSLVNGPDGTQSAVTPIGVFFVEAGTSTNNNGLYRVDDGSSNVLDTYAFRALTPLGTGPEFDTDLSLGSITGGTLTPVRYGLCLQNTTSAPITRLVIDYRGEQWRQGDATTDTLVFDYCIGGTCSPTAGTYNPVTGLNFLAPNTTAPVGLLDGNRLYDPVGDPPSANLGGRRNVGPVGIDVTLAPGEIIYLRWSDFDVTGNDDGLSIDNVNVAPIAATAAPAVIGGRVTIGGRGVSRQMVMLSGGDLDEPIYTSTNLFGYYRFEDVSVGETYVVQLVTRRYRFANPSIVVSLQDNVMNADFAAETK